jgi:hypothetical protein
MMDRIIAIGTAITVGFGALTVLAVILRKINCFMREFTSFIDDWKGTPARDGHEASPGVVAQLRELHRVQMVHGYRLTAIESQVTGNGGTSANLADVALRIEQSVIRQEGAS